MRLALRVYALWFGLLIAVVGGGFIYARLGAAGVAVYGVAVASLMVAAAVRSRRNGKFR
jgi:membrane protein implicated in regulation of membrane protease activity